MRRAARLESSSIDARTPRTASTPWFARWNLEEGEFAGGTARASLRLPDDLAPSFDGADLRLGYVIRVLVDRRFMPDTAIERPVAIT